MRVERRAIRLLVDERCVAQKREIQDTEIQGTTKHDTPRRAEQRTGRCRASVIPPKWVLGHDGMDRQRTLCTASDDSGTWRGELDVGVKVTSVCRDDEGHNQT